MVSQTLRHIWYCSACEEVGHRDLNRQIEDSKRIKKLKKSHGKVSPDCLAAITIVNFNSPWQTLPKFAGEKVRRLRYVSFCAE